MQILILTVPGSPGVAELEAMRDCAAQSLCGGQGVLVLPKEVRWSIEDWPEIGSVIAEPELFADPPQVEAVEEPDAGPAEPAGPEPAAGLLDNFVPVAPGHKGRGGLEKQHIRGQMKAYRSAHGLGCWKAVAEAAGDSVTDDMLGDMLIGALNPPLAVWRKVAKAIEQLEAADGAPQKE